MEFPDNLWLPFFYQQQPDVVVFEIIYFDIFKNIVTEWKYLIY